LGFLVGAILFALTYPAVFPVISGIANLGSVYLPELANVNEWLLIGLFTLVTLFLFYVLKRIGEARRDRTIE
jgi:membrane protein implicated in regulation of membrane protease activity